MARRRDGQTRTSAASKEVIRLPGYPLPPSMPYLCHAVRVGNFLFCSGVVGRDPGRRMEVVEGIESQTRQAFRNVEATLKAAGSGLEHLVKTTVYMRRREDFDVYARIRAEVCAVQAASTGVFGVELYDPRALIEIEAVAVIP